MLSRTLKIFCTTLIILAFLFLACQQCAHDERFPHYRNHSQLLVFLDENGIEHPVRTPKDWQRRRQHILHGMQEAMGKLPDKTQFPPFEVKELERYETDKYARLKISINAEENDRIPAYLYIPKLAKKKRLPAMLALHPTSALGKGVVAGMGSRPNRAYAHELAERGYIVIAPDYPSFGDYEYDFDADDYISGTMKGIFNHIRCVDLLASRNDVDSARIGVIGHSLGGHNAMFVGVFDTRLKVIVSSCGWTPFHDYYGGNIKGWTSPRYMPKLRDEYKLNPDLVPFDFYEVVAALAPRAFFSCSPLRDDNFDVTGVKKAIAEARKVFQLYRAEDQIIVRYPDCGHDFPPEIRLEAYEFIDRVLKL